MVLGAKGHSGEWHPFGHLRLFHEPNEAVVGPTGDLFVLQGHGKANSLVLKFDSEGNFIKAWGGTGKGPGQFDLPHSLVFDAEGLLYIADRNNARIQVFDAEGNLHSRVVASRHAVRPVHGRRPAHLAGARPLRRDHEARSCKATSSARSKARGRARRSANTARRITSRSARATRSSSPTR